MAVYHTAPFIDQNIAIDVGRGNLRLITGTLPAAGAEISETVPTAKLWVLLSMTANFTASAVAGNRIPIFRPLVGAVRLYRLAASGVITLGQLASLNWCAQGTSFSNNAVTIDFSIPLPLTILPAGAVISTVTSGLLAGDQWAAPFMRVQEYDV